ncbi:ankyrin repeat domain-containing protein [Candidatus Wolbachia massiliensis]|uniref:Ankyrin repeat domain-containing protein n=1 Tax=Candidatus Wolbachia massiliensis TaxID=1845000 RepID=A0A7M3U299_9RICK|nr:ankyrin repeat domain-containing protein [Candidatus Wolbachia massiliensis]QOD38534.1 ankyrin repeat domain-containing protein [Candidatus Wolbachia massiliensis]
MSKERRESFERFIGAFLDNPFSNVNERIEKGCTVLHYAAKFSDAGIIGLLIELEANINARDDRGETALHLAAFSGKVENVKALIEKGAKINAKSNNKAVPLHLASLAGEIETIEVLINAGGNINAIDKFGYSPLNYAKIYPRVTSYLEKKGVNMKDVAPMRRKAIKEIMEERDKQNVNELRISCKEAIEKEFLLFKEINKIRIL